jgi:phosphohistidine swiveling domain-containing protein
VVRVLICGVTSDLGRAFARAALGAGHEVIGVGSKPDRYLSPSVALTVGDAATAESLVPGSDVVVHLAPVEREVPESGGIPALRRLSNAAARHNIRFVAPIAHGPDAGDAERVVRDSGAQHVVVRTAPLGGRALDWQACRTIATLLSAPKDTQWRLLHADDLVRFLLHAIVGDRVGVISLAAVDVILAGRAREALRAVTPTPSTRGIASWPAMSTSDRKNSAREWGFECGWTSAEVVADLARGAQGRQLNKDGARDLLVRLPMPAEVLPRHRVAEDGTPLASVALPSLSVELDDRIDPRFPVYGGHGTAELFPGPLTPLSIDLHSAGLRAANRATGRLMGLTGPIEEEWESRGHAVFGHRVYAAVSTGVAAAPFLPGWTEQTVTEQAVGNAWEDLDLFPLDRPTVPTGPGRLMAKLGAWWRFTGVVRRYRARVKDFVGTAVAEHVATGELIGHTDAALVARARLLHDRLCEGWVLTTFGGLVAHAAAGPLRKRAKGDVTALGRGADVANEQIFGEVAALAALLRADEELRALAEWGDVEAVRVRFPDFGTAFDAAVERVGHRGPGEAELSSRTFADRPELVFAAAVSAARKVEAEPEPVEAVEPAEPVESSEEADAVEPGESTEDAPVETPPVRTKKRAVEKLAIAGQRYRELALDATMRYTDELRRLVREWGRRQVHAGRLVDVDDAFHLTLDELLGLPGDVLARVERRRVDLERMRAVRTPVVVAGSWRPEPDVDPMTEGKQLSGVGVSAGVVDGVVRVVSAAADADLEPGEILVTRLADVGHTALFGPAAAVVTDLGGPLSRAAVVARELGVPCVVHTKDASVRLVTGAFVRVDGAEGTVAVLSPAPATQLPAHG